jgi:hypothetical protein
MLVIRCTRQQKLQQKQKQHHLQNSQWNGCNKDTNLASTHSRPVARTPAAAAAATTIRWLFLLFSRPCFRNMGKVLETTPNITMNIININITKTISPTKSITSTTNPTEAARFILLLEPILQGNH